MLPRVRFSRTTLLLSTLIVTAVLFFAFSGDTERHEPRQKLHVKVGKVGSAKARAAVPRAEGDRIQQRDTKSPQVPIAIEGLSYDTDGLVHGFNKVYRAVTKAGGNIQHDQHPIIELMERGRRRWEGLLKRQSKTLQQAVTEYTKRYGRAPPLGFDEWFSYCKRNGVKIVDDYDQIERDIGPWLGIAPQEFRRRVDLLETKLPHSYKLTIRPDGPAIISGPRADANRPREQMRQLEAISTYLPKAVTIYGSDHDMGNSVLSDELRNAALDAAAKGTYLTEDELKRLESPHDHGLGLLASCSETSPARLLNGTDPIDLITKKESTFVYDNKPGMSYCENPLLMRYHGAFTWPQRRHAGMRPVFQLSKLSQNNEFLLTPLEAYKNASSRDGIAQTSPWSEKTINKLFWRGSTTGDSYTQPKKARPGYNWRWSHRPRLHLFAQNQEGEARVWTKRKDGWNLERWTRHELNEKYLDIGFAGRVHQCDKDGTCDEMSKELIFKDRVLPAQAKAYKYVFDVDGNGWSSRFHRLMSSGSVVVKHTIYPEWNSDWVTPWVHYVPSKLDYSDLYDIMSFFTGPPDDPSQNNDHLAKAIAENARKFTVDHWRWEDMQAYMLRMLLEYNRLSADDRDAESFYFREDKRERRMARAVAADNE